MLALTKKSRNGILALISIRRASRGADTGHERCPCSNHKALLIGRVLWASGRTYLAGPECVHSDQQASGDDACGCTYNSAPQSNPIGTLALPPQISKRFLGLPSTLSGERVDAPVLPEGVRPLTNRHQAVRRGRASSAGLDRPESGRKFKADGQRGDHGRHF
jgi:hypothetical protein